ncbi:MAG: hypothetical protein ABXS91_03120 [Sulfurimonas sp.]
MSNTQELKDYLIGDDGFLLDDMHNGKTIMLSGAWGAGKTHFWQNEIEPTLSGKLQEDDKSCTYISLYGKDSLNALKQEVFIKASSESSSLSKEVATFGFEALSSIEESDLAIGKVLSAAKGLNNYRKSTKGIKRLKDGGIICFDDFERKSKEIDLNDLFGFISQLSIEYQCKVVIILNSDVFEGEEKNIFKTVKEKTVNKFFHFEPSIEELFYLIANDEKYTPLEIYKTDILKAIIETEEVNARIYIQVLDNCLEWIDKGYGYEGLRTLVLSTIYFIKTNSLFGYPQVIYDNKGSISALKYKDYLDTYTLISNYIHIHGYEYRDMQKAVLYDRLVIEVQNKSKHSVTQEAKISNWLSENFDDLYLFVKYGYKLYVTNHISQEIYLEITEFIKTGILSKRDEVEA